VPPTTVTCTLSAETDAHRGSRLDTGSPAVPARGGRTRREDVSPAASSCCSGTVCAASLRVARVWHHRSGQLITLVTRVPPPADHLGRACFANVASPADRLGCACFAHRAPPTDRLGSACFANLAPPADHLGRANSANLAPPADDLGRANSANLAPPADDLGCASSAQPARAVRRGARVPRVWSFRVSRTACARSANGALPAPIARAGHAVSAVAPVRSSRG
jgi:hypothetical protein